MKFVQEKGANVPQKKEIGAFEVKDIDQELLLTTVHGGGTVKIRDSSEISYTFRSVPGGHPEKIIMVSSNGDMSIIDAKNVRTMEIINPETHDAIDILPGLRVDRVFEYGKDDGKIYSVFIKEILVTPGKSAEEIKTVKQTGAESPRKDIDHIDIQDLVSSVQGGGTVEITSKSGSIYTFRNIPGGSSEKLIMVHKQDGEMEILDAKKDLLFGVKVGEQFRFKERKVTDVILNIITTPGVPEKLYSQPLDRDLVAL